MLEGQVTYIINTLYALFAFVLIIFMVPGFAMLEAGIVRTQNVTAVLTTNTMIYAVASMAFLLIGYSIAFGDFESDPANGITLMGQIKGILVIAVFAFVSSYIVLFIINKFIPLRAENDVELEGLDVNECGVEAYPEFKRAF